MNRVGLARMRELLVGERLPQGPVVDGGGALVVGEDVVFGAGPVRTRISIMGDATCVLGDRVFLGHGSSISCRCRVAVGDDTRIGPFALVYDSDFHAAGSHDLRRAAQQVTTPKSEPVVIGSGVRIGEFVTILRGSTIGDGAVIEPASVIWGSIPARVRVAGNPKNHSPL